MNDPELVLSPTDFVALTNQILEFAIPSVYIEGELSNFKVSQNKWVFFDIKDEFSKVTCFASVYSLPGPLEDGMIIIAKGQPRLHPKYGFSLNVQTISTKGEGSIKKAYELLKNKLIAEGMFDESKKRKLPYPPVKICLVTSKEAAAFKDFTKIVGHRWPYLLIDFYNSTVQGEDAPLDIVESISQANQYSLDAEALIIIRGGGGGDDLAAFNDERVVRAIAGSRLPTLVAIGHESDELLAELAADLRASTPSNAAELLVPSRVHELIVVKEARKIVDTYLLLAMQREKQVVIDTKKTINELVGRFVENAKQDLFTAKQIIEAYNPINVLNRGYAIVEKFGKLVSDVAKLNLDDQVCVKMRDGSFDGRVVKKKLNI